MSDTNNMVSNEDIKQVDTMLERHPGWYRGQFLPNFRPEDLHPTAQDGFALTVHRGLSNGSVLNCGDRGGVLDDLIRRVEVQIEKADIENP